MNQDSIKEIIAKHAKLNVDDIKDDLDFKKDLHLDSIDLFQIIMEVEEKFNIKVDDNELLNIHTVKDALSRI
ncbi:MAG: acyl carrier protein [Lachnospiraceae bacterium]|nr:acyl carrier protein [Lachnospiraceae bacterium]